MKITRVCQGHAVRTVLMPWTSLVAITASPTHLEWPNTLETPGWGGGPGGVESEAVWGTAHALPCAMNWRGPLGRWQYTLGGLGLGCGATSF